MSRTLADDMGGSIPSAPREEQTMTEEQDFGSARAPQGSQEPAPVAGEAASHDESRTTEAASDWEIVQLGLFMCAVHALTTDACPDCRYVREQAEACLHRPGTVLPQPDGSFKCYVCNSTLRRKADPVSPVRPQQENDHSAVAAVGNDTGTSTTMEASVQTWQCPTIWPDVIVMDDAHDVVVIRLEKGDPHHSDVIHLTRAAYQKLIGSSVRPGGREERALAQFSESDIRDLFEIWRYVHRDPSRLAGVLRLLKQSSLGIPEASATSAEEGRFYRKCDMGYVHPAAGSAPATPAEEQ